MSNETQKVIRINPELFKLPTTGTTQKRNNKKIRVRDPTKTGVKTVKNTVNRSVLNHIRAKQSELFDTLTSIPTPPKETPFLSDFDKAMKHMESAVSKINVPAQKHNKTVKNTHELHANANANHFHSLETEPPVSLAPANIRISPQYGCLRGGKLPTYRTWKKTSNPIVPNPASLNPASLNPASLNPASLNPASLNPASLNPASLNPASLNPASLNPASLNPIAPNPIAPNPASLNPISLPSMPSFTEIQQTATRLTPPPPKPLVSTQQKKTFKRKYHVGKSKYYSKIGVLISNRTLRTQTVHKTQQIKQTPLSEIKRTLVKKGLIKVGSSAPPDVLRKMYESISLLVGDVENHNLETILHNYIHDNK